MRSENRKSNLVFYDGECGLCDRTVQWLLKRDKEKIFLFAPLQGETAKNLLKDLSPEEKSVDSLILIEDYQHAPKIHLMAKAVFRILWLLGGGWSFLGSYFWMPKSLIDPFYRLVAKNRHWLFPSTTCVIPDPNHSDQFLP